MPPLLDYRGTSEICLNMRGSSPGQTGSQAAASWTWAGWPNGLTRTPKPQKKLFQGQHTHPAFHWLIGCYNNEWTSLILSWLGLGCQTVSNLRRLACKFDLDWKGVARRFRFLICLLASFFGKDSVTDCEYSSKLLYGVSINSLAQERRYVQKCKLLMKCMLFMISITKFPLS